MPAPLETAAAPPPSKGEEFEFLIQELSAEFNRLQQRIIDLARENTELRASPGNPSAVVPAENRQSGKAGGKGAANDARSLKTTLACVEGDTTGDGSLMPSKIAAVRREIQRTSAWRRRSNQKAGHTDDSQARRESLGSDNSSVAAVRAARGTTTNVHRRSRVSFLGGANLFRLKAKFEYVDTEHTGLLHLDDLVRIMEWANEQVAYENLVNLLRALNGMEPLVFEGSSKEDPIEVDDGLGIDFDTFQKVVDEEHATFDHITPALVDCLAAFRRACSVIPEKDISTGSWAAELEKKRRRESRAKSMTAFWLETVPTCVIILNTVLAGLSADYPQHEGVWEVFEYIFVGFYTLEFTVKVRLYGCRGYFRGKDRLWNWFDFVCCLMSWIDLVVKIVVSMVVGGDGEGSDNPIFMMIKIFRLSRLARLLRTLRFKIFKELKMMVVGVVSGLRVLTWAIALLVILIYVVGVAMTNMIGPQEEEYKDVLAAMSTLFRCWTDGCAAYDGTPLAEILRRKHGNGYLVFHILMTMFVTVGLFNLIMAIFIDNVLDNQRTRKHAEMVDRTPEIQCRLKHMFIQFINLGEEPDVHVEEDEHGFKRFVSNKTHAAIDVIATGKHASDILPSVAREWEKLKEMDVSITKDVFMAWLENQDFQQLLDDAEIDTANRAELFDVLDADMGGELCLDELITGLMKLRGSVTKADIVAIRLKVRYLTAILENKELGEGTG